MDPGSAAGMTNKHMVSIIDLIFIIILFGFGFYGFFFGLIRTIGSLSGIIVGAWAAGHYYLIVFGWIKNLFLGYDAFGKIAVFLLFFAIINRLVVLLFSLINNAFGIVSIIPFLKSINRFLGAIFGLILGALILAVVLQTIGNVPFLGGWIGKFLVASKIIPFIFKVSFFATPLVSGIFDKAKISVPSAIIR